MSTNRPRPRSSGLTRAPRTIAWRSLVAAMALGGAATAVAQAPPPPPGEPRTVPMTQYVPSITTTYQLGVDVDRVYVDLPGQPRLTALRVRAVYPGSSAAAAGLNPGDVIVRVDGSATTSLDELRQALARSGGQTTLDVVKAGTGSIARLAPIRLAQNTVTTTRMVTVNVPVTTTIDSGHSYARSDIPTATAPGGEDDDELPLFPWPAPRASSKAEVPPNLIRKPGTNPSLFDISQRLETALVNAGYAELSYHAVPKGFALATQLEQFNEDGTPRTGNDRFSPVVIRPRVSDLASYLQSLFRATKGRFRIIVLVVTSKAVRENPDLRVTSSEASDWVRRGASKLPASFKLIPYTDDFETTALIYEFEKSAADNPAVQRDPGLGAQTHLEKSNLLRNLSQ